MRGRHVAQRTPIHLRRHGTGRTALAPSGAFGLPWGLGVSPPFTPSGVANGKARAAALPLPPNSAGWPPYAGPLGARGGATVLLRGHHVA